MKDQTTDDIRVSMLVQIGRALADDADLTHAISALALAVAIDGNSVQAKTALALTLARAEKLDRAMALLERIVVQDPQRLDAWAAIVEISLRAREYDTAAHAARECLRLDPAGAHPIGVRVRALVHRARTAVAVTGKGGRS